MKNLFVFKRMTAALLAVVILVSLLPVLSFATETEVFSEDFTSGDLSNWTEDVGTVDGGVYTLPGNTINYIKDIELTDVAVSADVMIYASEKANGFVSGTTAYVTARANQEAGTGYDFGIGVNGSGQTYVRLYRRDPNGVSKILYQDTAAIEGLGTIKTETIYNIKIATAENLIIGIINDVQVIQIEDTTFQSGSVGVRTLEGEAQFANISVVEVPERRVDSITIHTHSEELSKVGKAFFTATVDFNSVYGTLAIDQDTEGVTVSGLDCTTGDKTVTVKFMGGEATFPVKVVNSVPEKVIYETNFNTNDGTWNENYTDFHGYGIQIGNGYAAAYPPSKPADEGVADKASRPDEELAEYTDYYVQMQVKLMADIPTARARSAFASLQFAGVAGGGRYYEMRLASTGAINVYLDGTSLFSTNLKNVLGEAFEFGKTYTMKVAVYGDIAVLYVNGKQAGVFSAFEGGKCQPHAAIKAGNGTVLIDSFKSVALEAKGDHALSYVYLVTADGTSVGNKTLHSFSNDNYMLMLKYIDGTTIPRLVKDKMVSWYNPTGEYDQVFSITYGGKSCYVNYHYLPYLFYDNFDVFVNPDWIISTGNYMTYSIVKDRLRTEYDSKQPNTGNISFTCKGSEEWTDFSMSLDVFFDQRGNANAKDRYVNLTGRSDGKNYYQVRLSLNSAGAFTMQIGRFENSAFTAVATATAAHLSTALEQGEALGSGNIYNLRMDCVGNTVKAYFQNKLMLVYVDENPYLKGTAGVTIISNNALLDNFVVKSRSAGKAVGATLSNYPDGDITLWQGNDIPVWENELIIKYADGEEEAVNLTYEMIGPFANTELGKHSVDITYYGQTFPMEVTVLERPEYVADVASQMEAFADEVTKENKAAFLELKDLYDSLSPYEASGLSAELTDKYKALLHSYDYLIAPELVGDPILVNEMFNDEASYSTWIDGMEGSAGSWFYKNGVAYQAQLAYSRSGNGWRCPPIHGNITGISADIMGLVDMMHCGIGFNVGKDGYYHIRLSSTTLDEFSLPVWEFQFLRKSGGGHTKLTTIVLEAYGFEIGPGDWFNMTLTLEDDVVRAYLNGELIFTYEESEELYNMGEVGLRISTGDAICDNVRVYGTEVAREEKYVEIEPSYYTDDFEDETAGQNPSHWQEYRTVSENPDLWKVYDKDGNKVYGTTANGLTGTWLHAFDNDTSFTVKFMAENMSDTAKFGFITRMAPTTAFHVVGYDKVLQKWYAVSQDSASEGPVTYYQEDTFVIEPGRWYEAELVLNKESQSLKIDGVEVFALTEVYHTAHGRMGFFTNGADFFVDDYDLTMAAGDIPQDGVFSYEIAPGNFFEIEEAPNGELLGMNTTVWRSQDNGNTWFKDNSTGNPQYATLSSNVSSGAYTTFLKMSNGEYMQIEQSGGNMTLVRISKDMKTWTSLGYVVPEDKWTDAMGRSSAIFHIGSATEAVLADGTHRIFFPCAFRKYDAKGNVAGHHTEVYYSDDFGRTWTMSETTTKDIHPGWTTTNNTTWAESKVVSCADGTLRLYYPRNYLGCMQYSVSTDGGVTWGTLQQIPEIQMPMTSYAVYEDPERPGTWYMVCCDQVTHSLGSITPRDRFVLLRSYDGMNWEFLMNIERMFDHRSVENGDYLYQLLDPGLYVDEDYVHITFGRSEYEAYGPHQDQRIMYMRVEKDKLEARPWDASTIADMYYPVKIEFEEAPQTVFGLNDLFVCEGTLKLTDFLGNVTYEEIRKGARVYKEPDMFKLGTHTVELRYKNAYDLSYEIEVRPKAEILWTIEGEGTVDPKNRYIIEGTTQIVNLTPAEGWKLVEVWVGDEIVETPNNQLELTYDKNGLDIWVVFAEVTIFDSPWFYIGVGGGVLIAAGAALFFILAAKKKKNATPKQSPEA